MKVDVPKNDLNIFSQLKLTARLLTNIKLLTRSCGLMDKASDFYYNECRHPKIAGSSPATIKQVCSEWRCLFQFNIIKSV